VHHTNFSARLHTWYTFHEKRKDFIKPSLMDFSFGITCKLNRPSEKKNMVRNPKKLKNTYTISFKDIIHQKTNKNV
jgi:hypothetical protein